MTTPLLHRLGLLNADVETLCGELMVLVEPLLLVRRVQVISLRSEVDSLSRDTKLYSILLSQYTEEDINKLLGDNTWNLEVLEAPFTSTRLSLQSHVQQIQRHLSDNAKRVATAFNLGDGFMYHLPNEDVVALWTESIAHIRRVLSSSFKRVWYQLSLLRDTVTFEEMSNKMTQESQLGQLISSFRRKPFSQGLDASEDDFLSKVPKEKNELLHEAEYAPIMEEQGKQWSLEWTTLDEDTYLTDRRYGLFVQLLWSGQTETLREAYAQYRPYHPLSDSADSTFVHAQRQTEEAFRDSIIRLQSSVYSIVFVGAEDSGKSSFLNMLMGCNILPIENGPTTSIPCRIRHVNGLAEPVLEFDAEYMMRGARIIRDHGWLSKMENDELQAEDLPPGTSLEEVLARWSSFPYQLLVDDLTRISSPDFLLSSPVKGTDAIRRTLEGINSTVRLCRIFPVGYDRFGPEDWAQISLESGLLRREGPDGIYQLIDIPGLADPSDPYQWDELTRSVLRTANRIVVLVSMDDFNTSPWRRLPDILATHAGVHASAVVLTKSDLMFLPDIAYFTKQIHRFFWPNKPASSGLIWECSAKHGPSAQRLYEFLATAKEKPSYETVFSDEFLPAAREIIYPRRDDYDERSLESLQQSANDGAERMGYTLTFTNIKKMMLGHGHTKDSYEEALSLRPRLSRMDQLVTPLLISVGQSDINSERNRARRLQVAEEARMLIEEWDVHARLLYSEIKQCIQGVSDNLTESAKESAVVALSEAEDEMRQVQREYIKSHSDSQDIVELTSEESLEMYIKTCVRCFNRLLSEVEASRLEKLLKDMQQARWSHYSGFYGRVGSIDPRFESRLVLSSDESLKSSLSSTPQVRLPSAPHLISKTRTTYSVAAAFHKARETVFSLFVLDEDIHQRISNLRRFSRALLDIATAIPFILGLPFWLRKTYDLSYEVAPSSLQMRLIETAEERSRELLTSLEKAFMEEENQNSETLKATLGSYARTLEDISFGSGIDPSLKTIQALIYTHSNLLAAIGAIDGFCQFFGSSST
ncbi:hypothetical protein FRB91_006484 [Serendipita sp. 411]|nr:hypothetical protein FRB91_006484 [Serendipita sp. 411]